MATDTAAIPRRGVRPLPADATRMQRAAWCRDAVDAGYTYKQVAKMLGLTKSGVSNLLNDPDGSKQKARRVRYQGTCCECGGPTDGSGGYAKPATRCAPCDARVRSEGRYWTQERVLAAIRLFNDKNGRPPLSHEWLYGKHGQAVDGYPYTGTVLREFGTWAEAIERAGFPRPWVGWKPLPEYPNYRKPRIATETLIQRLRDASRDGFAPSTEGARGLYERFRARGISWPEACELAGVRPRRSRWYAVRENG